MIVFCMIHNSLKMAAPYLLAVIRDLAAFHKNNSKNPVQAAAASLIQRLQLEDAVESSSDILLDTTADMPAALQEPQMPPDMSIAPQPALSQPDRTAVSLSNALRDIVHERELALEMRPMLHQVMENAAQSGVQPQDSLAWQLAGELTLAELCSSQPDVENQSVRAGNGVRMVRRRQQVNKGQN